MLVGFFRFAQAEIEEAQKFWSGMTLDSAMGARYSGPRQKFSLNTLGDS